MAKKDAAADDAFDTFGDEEGSSLLVDLSNVEEQNFDAIPVNRYNVVVDECKFAISKSSGSPMWAMRFNIVDGEYANRKLFHYMSFSEKALPMTKRFLARLNPELAETAFNPKQVAEENTMLGCIALAKVGLDKGQDGEPRNVIKDILMAADNDDGFGI